MEAQKTYRLQIVWPNVIVLCLYHYIALQGLYYLFFCVKFQTFIWTLLFTYITGQGITAGAHRLWAHKSYKAKLPLRIILAILQTVAFQNSIYEWCRDHRVHHKFSDTDADPHNVNRGFFFSHMGWLMVRKHPDVLIKGKTVDMSDLEADPVVRFQKKYYVILAPLFCFVLPTLIPWYFWSEQGYYSFATVGMLRYVIVLHGTWSVNSVAHIWGYKPYDKNIHPVENRWVSNLTNGEGWHNYHHTFPWDYKAAELDSYNGNLTTAVIDLMARIGWAYDLKSASTSMVQKRIDRTGMKEEEIREETTKNGICE